MNIVLPESFLVPVHYVSKDSLDFEKKSIKANSLYKRQGLIGVSLPSEREDKWIKDKKAMEKQADLIGVPIMIESANNDESIQAKQIESLISKGINILILAPINSETLKPIIDKARELGIKIIAYDRLLLNTYVDIYVTFSASRIGNLQGRYLTGKSPTGNYIILSGDRRDSNSILLKKGAMEYIEPLVLQRRIKVIEDEEVVNWDPDNAYNIMKPILNKNYKIHAVLSPNDKIAGAVIKALSEKNLAGEVYVTGQDSELEAVQRIVKGTQGMTIFKDTRELGKKAIDVAVKLSRGEPIDIDGIINNGKIEVRAIFANPIMVDKSNLEEVLINSGYLNKNEVYMRLEK